MPELERQSRIVEHQVWGEAQEQAIDWGARLQRLRSDSGMWVNLNMLEKPDGMGNYEFAVWKADIELCRFLL